jgi:hypothetical protein
MVLGGAALVACGFDASGSGEGSETDTDDGSTGETATTVGPGSVSITTMSSATSTTATTTTAGESTTSVDDSTGPGTSDDGPSSDETTSTASTDPSAGESSSGESSGGDACAEPPPFAAIHYAADAVVVAPMELVQSMLLPGMPEFARSTVPDMGTVTFDVNVDCADTYYVWGLVVDQDDGANTNGFNNGPDSFYYAVDGDADPAGDLWLYGCQTEGLGDPSWSWQRVERYIEPSCMVEDWSVDLAAGPHSFQLLNREDGGDSEFAGVHSIVVSNDPAFDPNTLYDPTP